MNVRALWIIAAVLVLAAGGIYVFRSLTPSPPRESAVATAQSSVPPASTTAAPDPAPAFVDPRPQEPTKVVNVVAVTASGDPAAGYTVTENYEISDDCTASRAAVAQDVVSCGGPPAGADVCWIAAGRTTLLCGTAPWEKSLRRITLPSRLGVITADEKPLPWGLELANGARCQLRNGGSWPGRADDYVGYYRCDQESIFVVGKQDHAPVDQAGTTWTALVGGLSADNAEFPPPTKTRVVTAYFAARQ